MFKKYIQKIILATKDWKQNCSTLDKRSYGFQGYVGFCKCVLLFCYSHCSSSLHLLMSPKGYALWFCLFLVASFVPRHDRKYLYSISGEWGSWSDCADAQSDQDPHCPLIELSGTVEHNDRQYITTGCPWSLLFAFTLKTPISCSGSSVSKCLENL